MVKIINQIFEKIGIDGAILYTSLARIIQAGGGLVTIFFVAKFLTGIEQGFYYTFGSVLAIQIFFELGLNGIITQYVAHEASHLNWESDTKLIGSENHLSRLSSLLHFAVKWYLIFAGFLLVILLFTGYLFFNRYNVSGGIVEWTFPWILLSVSTTMGFIINPVFAFMEGLGKVKAIAQLRLIQQIFTTLMVWITMVLHAKLYSSGISSILGFIIVFTIFFCGKYSKLLIYIWMSLGKESVNYKNEIFPYQWKIALSWVSGYFIFQLFNPVLFATEGAVIAGQMGMTLAALNGILGLSLSWMSTKIPLYAGLIAQKNYIELDKIFNKTLNQSTLINGLLLIILFLFIYALKYLRLPLGNRFLPYFPLILMMIPIFLNQIIASWATYLRCHKQEPFLIQSITIGILTCLSTLFLGKYFGVGGMTLGYCLITLFGLIWGSRIFITKKLNWHASNNLLK